MPRVGAEQPAPCGTVCPSPDLLVMDFQYSPEPSRICTETRVLIRRMAEEDAGWGAPNSCRCLLPTELASSGAFFRNHREVMAAIEMFTVPTLTFRVSFCPLAIEHGRCWDRKGGWEVAGENFSITGSFAPSMRDFIPYYHADQTDYSLEKPQHGPLENSSLTSTGSDSPGIRHCGIREKA